jgi:ribosomal-protein-alanine N-acetyltransferase
MPTPPQPNLTTPRLLLRPLATSDAPEIQRLAGDWAIARMTLSIPHPYGDGVAEQWIASQAEAFALGQQAAFAISLREGGTLVGSVGLMICPEHARAELGFWIGRPFWGRGYCTEAAGAVIRFGFEQLGLNRIFAHHFAHNPASGRVMQKLGMKYEGRLRQHVRKWGKFVDIEQYSILKGEMLGGDGRP